MTYSLDIDLKAVFDEIVGHSPDPGPTPTHEIVTLAETESSRRPWLAVAAATITVVGVGGIAALNARPTTSSPAASPTSPSPMGDTPTTAPAVPTTSLGTLDPAQSVPVGEVVCLDAGAGLKVALICAEEFGGQPSGSTTRSDESFVMPVNATNPAHKENAERLAAMLNLVARPYDPSYLPAGGSLPSPAASVILVLGESDDPYVGVDSAP